MKLASLLRASSALASLALAVVASGVGCSSSDGQTPDKPGYTSCGDVTCSPGQHCAQPSVSICEEGCVSDENCPSGQICETGSAAFRKCIGSTVMPPPVDSLAACKAACDHFQSCGLSAAETAQCRTDCESLTKDQQTAIANCGDDECSAVPQCLGVECVSSNDCPNDQSCVGYTCMGGV